jgi:2-amino-4-hydroxy-6-hydroxymethyldihydropteridine diphosphokinase
MRFGPRTPRFDEKARVFLSLGSNLGDRKMNLRRALQKLKATPGLFLGRVSSIYDTAPVGPVSKQPRFYNLVAELFTELSPRDLQTELKRIQAEGGPAKKQVGGPRLLDIDILLFGNVALREPELEIPHPRMWGRAFVVVPLAELEPALRGPGGVPLSELADRLRREQAIYAKLPV